MAIDVSEATYDEIRDNRDSARATATAERDQAAQSEARAEAAEARATELDRILSELSVA